MKKLEVGDPAPSFKLSNQVGTEISLTDFKGKRVIVYFYPRDFTSGCTTEACAFRDEFAVFKKQGVVVLGISPDGVKTHAKFAEKHQLPFDLLADEEKRAVKDYGVWVRKSMCGVKYMGVERSTFLIGIDGKIQAIFRKVKPSEHVEEMLNALKSSKI